MYNIFVNESYFYVNTAAMKAGAGLQVAQNNRLIWHVSSVLCKYDLETQERDAVHRLSTIGIGGDTAWITVWDRHLWNSEFQW